MDRWNQLFAVCIAVDVLVACSALAWAQRAPDGRARLQRGIGAGLLLAALWLVRLGVLRRVGLVDFGLMHLVLLDLVVLPPTLAVLLLLTGRPEGRRLALAAVGLATVPASAYAVAVEPARLVVERSTVRVPAERAGDDPVRVAVLADLQFDHVGTHEREAVRRALALDPDLVLLPGDVFQGSAGGFRRERPRIRALLRPLARVRGGAWFVAGDSERGDPVRAADTVAGTGIRLLHDESRLVRVGDRRIRLTGLGLFVNAPPAARVLAASERAPGATELRIVVSHRPDSVLRLPPTPRTDLVVAGHTHGGQIAVPGYGPPFVLTDVPRHVAAGGLHVLPGGRRIYVSRGIGVERGQAPRIRVGAPPEVSLLTLTD